MSDQKDRWSASRERDERRRAREAEREALKRQRLERQTNPEPDPIPRRHQGLSDEEKQAAGERRFSTPIFSELGGPETDSASSEAPAADGERPRRSRLGTSRRWRESVDAANIERPTNPTAGASAGLPPLPGDTSTAASGGRGGGNGGKVIIFGASLFAVMALIFFLPFGPFGEDGSDPTPTSEATRPAITSDTPEPGQSTEEPTTDAGADNKPIVCIDPGHGGWDTGFTRYLEDGQPAPEVTEAELNLGMALMLRDEIEARGVTVVMTRESGGAVNAMDEDVNGDGQTRRSDLGDPALAQQAGERDELQARINICNNAGADILISVHLNGFDDQSARGYEVIYTEERDFGDLNLELATDVYRRLDQAMSNSSYGSGKGRTVKKDSEITVERDETGSEQHYIMIGPAVTKLDYEITPSAMPGVIVEGVFISNDADAAWIINPANQEIVVKAYADGIMDYFERHPG